MDDKQPQVIAEFTGGMRWPAGIMPLQLTLNRDAAVDMGGNVTWPFVKLRMHERGLDLVSHGFIFKSMTPSFHFRWSDVQAVECIRRGGIRFRIAGLHHSIIFWSLKPAEVLDVLEQQGVSIDRRPHKVGWFL
jgi:hypothetical protein